MHLRSCAALLLILLLSGACVVVPATPALLRPTTLPSARPAAAGLSATQAPSIATSTRPVATMPATLIPLSSASGAAPPADKDRARPAPPGATLRVAGSQQPAGITAYLWRAPGRRAPGAGSQTAVYCVDEADFATSAVALRIGTPLSATLEFALPQAPSKVQMQVLAVQSEERLGSAQGTSRWPRRTAPVRDLEPALRQQIGLPLDAGLYVLIVFAAWQGRGEATYGFLVEVQDH